MLQSVELSRLVKISLGFGGFTLVSIGSAVAFTETQFRKNEFYKSSMKMIRNYPPGMKLLGAPIRSKNLNLFTSDCNWIKTNKAKLTIPVKGQYRLGTLYSWGSRLTVEDSWTIDKCELEVCEKRWTFYVNPGSDSVVVQPNMPHTSSDLEEILSESEGKHKHLLAKHNTP